MPWSIPDKGEGDSNIQSILFQEYLDALVAGIEGLDCVLSGLAMTAGTDLTPNVAKGAVLTNGVLKAVAASTVTIGAADATNPRIDLVVVNASGALAVRAGTAAANPKPPARTANDVIIAAIFVPATATQITQARIVDLRVMRSQGPITLYKTTAAETTNNTAGAVHILDKTNSGVVIPNGLFLAGKQLRVNIGGNFLANSGTPTFTLTIAYGGTTMFADVTGSATADTDRIAWNLGFIINAQANNDQALSGRFNMAILGGKTAPATGISDIASPSSLINPIGGAAAVDSNAANRTLTVTVTMSVANAANEIITEFASVELV